DLRGFGEARAPRAIPTARSEAERRRIFGGSGRRSPPEEIAVQEARAWALAKAPLVTAVRTSLLRALRTSGDALFLLRGQRLLHPQRRRRCERLLGRRALHELDAVDQGLDLRVAERFGQSSRGDPGERRRKRRRPGKRRRESARSGKRRRESARSGR